VRLGIAWISLACHGVSKRERSIPAGGAARPRAPAGGSGGAARPRPGRRKRGEQPGRALAGGSRRKQEERVEGVSRSLPFSDLLALTSSDMFLSVMD
jgi:hypothetical protein